MANPIQLSGLSLFSGVGMLDEAVGLALAGRGIQYRTAVSCEWESGAASTLLARMEEQSVERHPVWCGDLRDFPAELFAGRIDILSAGYPCQPFSRAGLQRGLEDERALGDDGDGPIAQMLRIIGTVKPRFVFLENVGAALEHFRPIGQELESMGYEIAPPILLAAEDVGASHKRERMFALAELADCTSGRLGERGESSASDGQPHGGDTELEDTSRDGRGQRSGRERAGAAVQELADTSYKGRERSEQRIAPGPLNRQSPSRPTPEFREIQLFAPGPGDEREWIRILTDHPHLAPAIQPNTVAGVSEFHQRLYDDTSDSVSDEVIVARVAVIARNSPDAFANIFPPKRRLNPRFVCWLMGWPTWWTHPVRTSFGARETESWRSKAQLHLNSIFANLDTD